MDKIRVAIIGVGNCASSLVQGVEFYKNAADDERIPGQAALAEEVAGEILGYCVEAGGSITGEHGVGADKKEYMPRMFSADDLDVMQQVRDAIDPQRICNPGKVLPTPRLCGEVPGPYRQHPIEAAGLGERF